MNLPDSAQYGKRIPKQKLYEHGDIPPAVKRCFIDQVRGIRWAYKLAPDTMNMAPGKDVTEVEVFRIELTGEALDEAVLRAIDKSIPYHILFLLVRGEDVQAWISYKEIQGGRRASVDRYYHTDWMGEDGLPLRIEGLTMDAVYENFVRQIAGEALSRQEEGTLRGDIETAKQIEKLKKDIEKLRKKIGREVQLNRRMEYFDALRKIKKELESLQKKEQSFS